MYSKTLFSILWGKFLASVESASWSEIFVGFAKFFSALVIGASLCDISMAADTFVAVYRWADYALLKFLGAFLLVFGGRWYISPVLGLFDSLRAEFASFSRGVSEDPLFYGVPVVELVEYMFSGRGFVRSEVERRFGIPRNKFDEMAKKLDDVRVFVRGSNNARVINPEMSRADISSILFRAAESGEVRPLIREVKNGYTHAPSMPELRSSSGFVTRPLSDFRVSAS